MFTSIISTFLSVTLSFTTLSSDIQSPTSTDQGLRRQPSVITETTNQGVKRSISAPYTPLQKEIFTYIPPRDGNPGEVIEELDSPNSPILEQNIYTTTTENTLENTTEDPLPDSHYANLLTDMDIDIESGSDFAPNTYSPDEDESEHCEMLVYRTIEALPDEHTEELEELNLFYSDTGRRGYGGYDKIFIRCTDQEDAELSGVLIHEMGHIVDLGVLEGSEDAGKSVFRDGSTSIYQNDPSVEFYQISWQNSYTRKTGSDDLDFVTGYAKTDPFEDFAESYSFYLLQGDSFREMSKYNSKIAEKYEFMKENVFDGVEYDLSDELPDLVFTRNYDSTILEYDLDKLFDLESA